MKEEYFIDKYLKKCSKKNELFPIQIGDDCAVIKTDRDIVVSTDACVEKIHFPEDLDPYFIAFRSIAVAASDLIAMGSYPVGFLLTISHPNPDDKWFESFTEGIQEFNTIYGTTLIGGDLTKGELNISVTVFGEAPSRILKRDMAEHDDDIFVSNKLGLGRLGLNKVLNNELNLPNQYIKPSLLSKKETVELNKYLNAAIDVSDGLLLDLSRICEKSGVGAHMQIEDKFLTNDFDDLIAGDDYVLLFTAPNKSREQILRISESFQIIGKITNDKSIKVFDSFGKKLDFKQKGWDSFN